MAATTTSWSACRRNRDAEVPSFGIMADRTNLSSRRIRIDAYWRQWYRWDDGTAARTDDMKSLSSRSREDTLSSDSRPTDVLEFRIFMVRRSLSSSSSSERSANGSSDKLLVSSVLCFAWRRDDLRLSILFGVVFMLDATATAVTDPASSLRSSKKKGASPVGRLRHASVISRNMSILLFVLRPPDSTSSIYICNCLTPIIYIG